MKFTILSACYNQVKYVPQLIKSLQAQTFKDFEVIFLDDASTDGTTKLLKGDLGFPYRVIKHRFHYGMRLGQLINKAVKIAKGEYTTIIMGDSFPPADYMERLSKNVNPYCVINGIRIHVDDNHKFIKEDYRVTQGMIPRYDTIIEQNCHLSFTGNGLTIPTKDLKAVGWGQVHSYGGDDTLLLFKLWTRGLNFLSLYTLTLFHHHHNDRGTNDKNLRTIAKDMRKFYTRKLVGVRY